MRWVTFEVSGKDRVGVLAEDGVHALPTGTSMVDVLKKGNLSDLGAAVLAGGEILPLQSGSIRAPVPVPPSIRDFLAFEEHLRNARLSRGQEVEDEWYNQPVFYFSNPVAVKGSGEPVPVPPGCARFDYELEIAAVIGREGSDLQPEEADEYIAGYAILCDWSARDLQAREMKVGLGPAKGKDSSTSLGPWLVTSDELSDVRSGRSYSLAMRAEVNGVEYSSGNLDSIHWSFGEMVAFASQGTKVVPGDVIGSGTVGRGCILELSGLFGSERYPWLRAGDEVTLEVERLGRLDHKIVEGSAPVWEPAERRQGR